MASTLGWVLVLTAGLALADPIRLPAIQGLSRAPLRGRTRHRSAARRHSGRRGGPNGSTVGVAQPIIINFPGLVDDAGATESAVHVFQSRRFPARSTG